MMREELIKYIRSLDDSVIRIWQDADRECISIEDTLSDEFQICAEILAVFEKYAKRYLYGEANNE